MLPQSRASAGPDSLRGRQRGKHAEAIVAYVAAVCVYPSPMLVHGVIAPAWVSPMTAGAQLLDAVVPIVHTRLPAAVDVDYLDDFVDRRAPSAASDVVDRERRCGRRAAGRRRAGAVRRGGCDPPTRATKAAQARQATQGDANHELMRGQRCAVAGESEDNARGTSSAPRRSTPRREGP